MKTSSKPPNSPSVSASFQEELVSTIHGAFQVAVEITVLEVTKLLAHRMGELRGQVHERTQENHGLKQRLQEAEEQLEILRGYMGGGGEGDGGVTPSGGPPGGPQPAVLSSRGLHGASVSQEDMDLVHAAHHHSHRELKTEPQADPEEDATPPGRSEDGDVGGTFREICADGSVLSQQYPPPETSARHHHDREAQENVPGVRKTESSAKPSCRDAEFQLGGAAMPPPRPRGAEDSRSCSVQLVRIKEEKTPPKEDHLAADCCFDPMEDVEDFGPDSLSLVQSKMLEEWKPEEMLDDNDDDGQDHPGHPPDPVVPGPSCALGLPADMSRVMDLPQLSGGSSSSSAPDFSSSTSSSGDFSNHLLPPVQASSSSSSSSSSSQTQVVYGVHVRASGGRSSNNNNNPPAAAASGLHVCKLCGQAFHAPSLLRRHYAQCQQSLQHQNHHNHHNHNQQQTTTARQQATSARPQAAAAVSTGAPQRTKVQLYPPGCSPFRCTVCSRDFNRMENLKTHLRIHTGERPYTCSVCAKRFRHSGALKRHFRIHTGEKPYACAQCGKTFRNCGGLKFHQRAHSRQWEYGNVH